MVICYKKMGIKLLLKNEFIGCHGRRIFIGLPKSTLLQVPLTIQNTSQVNSCDNNMNFYQT